jgi:hypothetical protein
LTNFYVGYSSHFLCDSLGRAVFFTSYEYLKRRIIQEHKSDKRSSNNNNSSNGSVRANISIPERMASACVAGMLSSGIIYPLDVLRSKIYCHSALFRAAPPSEIGMAREIYSKQGLRPFFRGFHVAVVRSGPVAAVALPVYDLALEYLTAEP